MIYSLIDSHCDTVTKALDNHVNLFNNGFHVDLAKVGDLDYTQFFAVFISPEYKNSARKRAMGGINKLKSEIYTHYDRVAFCVSYNDYLENKGKIRAFLSLEGGEPITCIGDLEVLYREGIRMATLTWNFSNQLGAGVLEEDKSKGLTKLGRDIIREMNRLGIIVDVSHLNDKSFWDVMEITARPVVASHSNSRTICSNPRNLTDEQFKAVMNTGGVVGINLYPVFLADSGEASIDGIIKHIEYFLSLGGENNIGIGADFDGIEKTPEEIAGIQDMYKLFDRMLSLGYSENLIKKLSCTNMERILQEIL